MKKLLVLSVAILFVFTMNAQKIGAKIGYGMSGYMVNFYVPDGSKMGQGLNFGLVGEMPVNDMMSLRFDVGLNTLGSDYETSYSDTSLNLDITYKEKTNVKYLNIGVSPKFSFGPAYVFVGPYFGYALSNVTWTSAKIGPVPAVIVEVDNFEDPLAGNGGSGDYYNKVDFGANIGLGVNMSKFFIEANAGMGLLNFINTGSQYYSAAAYATKDDATVAISGDASQKNLFFGLSLGYMFNFGE